MNPEQPWADMLAITGGRISYVGASEEALKFTSQSTKVIDLQGKMVLPSFQDVHIHPLGGGLAYSQCHLFGLETLEQLLDKVKVCVLEAKDQNPVLAAGWGWELFTNGDEPHRRLLDSIDSDKAIILADSDGHTYWLNSAALAFAGIDAQTPVPDGGDFGRDDKGELTGTLMEGPAMGLVDRRLPSLSLAQREQALLYTQTYLHSLGITAIQDAMVVNDFPEKYKAMDAFASLQNKGQLDLRVQAALYWVPGGGLGQIDNFKAIRDTFNSPRLKATSVKFWADGILETHTAKMLEPYTDDPSSTGLLMIPRDELMAAIPLADAAGFQSHVHTIGDGTVRIALDAFEKSRELNGVRDSRFLTAHTQQVNPLDIERFAELDVIAGFSPYWAQADDYVAGINPAQLGEERMTQMYPMGALVNAGAKVAFGSDWYVASADPLLGIETAVSRTDPETSSLPVFLPDQRIALHDAIAGYTRNAAFANFLDEDTGTIEQGKFADLVVLDNNLFEIPMEKISDSSVIATLIEGKIVFGDL